MRIRLRRFHRDGQAYVWRAEIGAVGGRRCVRVRVWRGGKNSCALQVDLLSTATDGENDGSYPSTEQVRALVDLALAHGWEPDLRGGTFVLNERVEGLAL